MIIVDFIGRLGNNIFQYVLAKIISDKLNFSLRINNNQYPTIFNNIEKENYYFPTFKNDNTILINLEEILNDKTPRYICLNGFFQRYEYYKAYKDNILNWINIKQNISIIPSKNDLVLHVRGGDLLEGPYNNVHPPCPFAYYKNIIENSSYDKLYIVTEKESDIVAQKIKSVFNGIIISNSVIEDFNFLLNAENIVLSLSTLAWWAAWLGKAKTAHFPRIGMWHSDTYRNNLDLEVDEDRYIYHNLYKVDNWCGSSQQIKKILSDNLEKWE